ncbi:MAG TPA: FAD-dependent oxidoreductase, partial [Bacteroidales bacterium]|nr:FAD-dependent oxidoreductase [Bacteroidales bacterium]
MSRNDVVIIGSGLSGLLCGVILAREGLGVTVLEKEPRAGGNLLTFSRNGVNFETGVHYVGS